MKTDRQILFIKSKRILLFILPALLAIILGTSGCKKKSQGAVGGKPDPQLSQDDNDYFDRQDGAFLDSVQAILSEYPPAIPEARERGLAKMLMDGVMHDRYAAFRKPVREFFRDRVDKVIRELEKTRVDSGAVIWKIYNMGFIVRTGSVTLAFDLVTGASSGSGRFEMSSADLDRLVRQCDVLFISHRHEDHAEKRVAGRFIDLGKPVVAPPQVWEGEKISKKIIHPDRIAGKLQQLPLPGGKILGIIIYPGHQMEKVDMNVVLARTPEGISVAHLGDQLNEGNFMEDFAWIDNVAKTQDVDIMMPNCWTNDIDRIVRGFDPRLVLPGHELELGHSLWDRVPFWGDAGYLGLTWSKVNRERNPVIALVWGESYHYLPHPASPGVN